LQILHQNTTVQLSNALCVDHSIIFRHVADSVRLCVIVNPSVRQVFGELSAFLADTESYYRQLVYAGCAADCSGCWLLRDGTFSYDDLLGTLPDSEQRKLPENHHVVISAFAEGKWSQSNLSKLIPHANVIFHSYSKADDKPVVSSAVSRFVDRISSLLTEITSHNVSAPNEAVVGNEKPKFSRPTLLAFPSDSSVSATVELPGFTFGYADCGCLKHQFGERLFHNRGSADLLVVPNVGFSDALNLASFQNGLTMKHLLLNDLRITDAELAADKCAGNERGLLVQLRYLLDGTKRALHKSNISSETCILPSSSNNLPSVIKLYQKVGMGSADLLVIHPATLKEVKQSVDDNRCDCLSSVLVWKPFDDDAKVLRIFFPGTAPICKVYEGLERLRGNAMFEAPSILLKNVTSKTSMKQEFSPKQAQQQTAKTAATKSAVKSATAIAGKSVGSPSVKAATKVTAMSKTKDNLKHNATMKTNSSKHVPSAEKLSVVSNRRQQTEKSSNTTSKPLCSSHNIPTQCKTPSKVETRNKTNDVAEHPVPANALAPQQPNVKISEIPYDQPDDDDTDRRATADGLIVQTTIATEVCENESKPAPSKLDEQPDSSVISCTAEEPVIESAKIDAELHQNVMNPDDRRDSDIQSDVSASSRPDFSSQECLESENLHSKSDVKFLVCSSQSTSLPTDPDAMEVTVDEIRQQSGRKEDEDEDAVNRWTSVRDSSALQLNDQTNMTLTTFTADDPSTQFPVVGDLAQDGKNEIISDETWDSVSSKGNGHVISLNRLVDISGNVEVNDCSADRRLLVKVSDNEDITGTSANFEPGDSEGTLGADNTDRKAEIACSVNDTCDINQHDVDTVIGDNTRGFTDVIDAHDFDKNSDMASSHESYKNEEKVVVETDDMAAMVCSGEIVEESLAVNYVNDAVETPETEILEDVTTNIHENTVTAAAAADYLEEDKANATETNALAENIEEVSEMAENIADNLEDCITSATVSDSLAENFEAAASADTIEEKIANATATNCLADHILGDLVPLENMVTSTATNGGLESAAVADCLEDKIEGVSVIAKNTVAATPASILEENVASAAIIDNLEEDNEGLPVPTKNSVPDTAAISLPEDFTSATVTDSFADGDLNATAADSLEEGNVVAVATDFLADDDSGIPLPAENVVIAAAADSSDEKIGSAAASDFPVEKIIEVPIIAEGIVRDAAADSLEENIASATATDCLAVDITNVPFIAENIQRETATDNIEDEVTCSAVTSSLAENIVVAISSEGREDIIASDAEINRISKNFAESPVHAENVLTGTAADDCVDNITSATVTDSLEERNSFAAATNFLADDGSGIPLPAENVVIAAAADSGDDKIGSAAASDFPAENIIEVPVIAQNIATDAAADNVEEKLASDTTTESFPENVVMAATADSLKEIIANDKESDDISKNNLNKETSAQCVEFAEREDAAFFPEHSDSLSSSTGGDFDNLNCEIIPRVAAVSEANVGEKIDMSAEDASCVTVYEINADEAGNSAGVTECKTFVADTGVNNHIIAPSCATNNDENANTDGTTVICANSREESSDNETGSRVANALTDTANVEQEARKLSGGDDDYRAPESIDIVVGCDESTYFDLPVASVLKSDAYAGCDKMEIDGMMSTPTNTDVNTRNAAVPNVRLVENEYSETFDEHKADSPSSVTKDETKTALTVFVDDVIDNDSLGISEGGLIGKTCADQQDEINQNRDVELSHQICVHDSNDPSNQSVTDARTSVDGADFQVCSPYETTEHIDSAAGSGGVTNSTVDEDYKVGDSPGELGAPENDTGFNVETPVTVSSFRTDPEPVFDTGVTTNNENTYVSMELVQSAVTCTDGANFSLDVAEPNAEQDALNNRAIVELTGAADAHVGDDATGKSCANEEHNDMGNLEIANENGETFCIDNDAARTLDSEAVCIGVDVANTRKGVNNFAATLAGTVDGSSDTRQDEGMTAKRTLECTTDSITVAKDETVSTVANQTVIASDSGDHDDIDSRGTEPVSLDVTDTCHTTSSGYRADGNSQYDVPNVEPEISKDLRYSQSNISSAITCQSNDTNFNSDTADHPSSSPHEVEPVCGKFDARSELYGDPDVSQRNTEDAEENPISETVEKPLVDENSSVTLQAGVDDYSSREKQGSRLKAESASYDSLDSVSGDGKQSLVISDSEGSVVPCDTQETLMVYSTDRSIHDVDRATSGVHASADAETQDSDDAMPIVAADGYSSFRVEADERPEACENTIEERGTWQQFDGAQTCDKRLVHEYPSIMKEAVELYELAACCSEEGSAVNSNKHSSELAPESHSDSEMKCETESTYSESDRSTYTGVYENDNRGAENLDAKESLLSEDTELLERRKHNDEPLQCRTNMTDVTSETFQISHKTDETDCHCLTLDDYHDDARYCAKIDDPVLLFSSSDASNCSALTERLPNLAGMDEAETRTVETVEPGASHESVTFDPIAEWGEPMALPAPAPVQANKNKQGKGKDNDEPPKLAQSAATPPRNAPVKSSLGPQKSTKQASKPTVISPRHNAGEKLTVSRDVAKKGEKATAEGGSAPKSASPSVRPTGVESDRVQVSLIYKMDDNSIRGVCIYKTLQNCSTCMLVIHK
jgi:hypothetical protein